MPESPSNHLSRRFWRGQPQVKRPHAGLRENRNILVGAYGPYALHRFDIRSNSNSGLNGIIFTALYAWP
jgi:hypothetical protein